MQTTPAQIESPESARTSASMRVAPFTLGMVGGDSTFLP